MSETICGVCVTVLRNGYRIKYALYIVRNYHAPHKSNPVCVNFTDFAYNSILRLLRFHLPVQFSGFRGKGVRGKMHCSLRTTLLNIVIRCCVIITMNSAALTDGIAHLIDTPDFTFYDPETNATLRNPVVTKLTYDNFAHQLHNHNNKDDPVIVTPRLPFIGQPCSCGNLNCGCCAGVTTTRPRMQQRQCK